MNFLRLWLLSGDGIAVAAVVSMAMFCTIILAKCIGGALPILAKAVKLDPALMASPMLTTITDACSILVFFIFVMAILGGRL